MSAGYPSRTSVQRMSLAGAAALVLLLVVGGGWLVWRGITSTAPQPPVATAGSVDESPAVRPPAFGAPEVVAGVPWGFPLTGDGAAAAAVTAVAVTGQPHVVFDRDRFEQVANVVFAPGQLAEQIRQVDAARTEFETSGWAAQPPSRRMFHFAPLAVSVVSFDAYPPAASVQVWAMTLVGVGDMGGAVFTTSTVELTADAQGESWQVVSIDTVEGPTPLVGEVASAPGRTRALLRDASATLPLPIGLMP